MLDNNQLLRFTTVQAQINNSTLTQSISHHSQSLSPIKQHRNNSNNKHSNYNGITTVYQHN